MVYCRLVDGFLLYISRLIEMMFKQRPEMLKAAEKDEDISIAFSTILEYGTMDQLIAAVIEARVTALSYKGMVDVAKYAKKRFGFELFENNSHRDRAMFLIELRNLIVHNRGIVNSRFINRCPKWKQYLGEKIDLTEEGLWQDFQIIMTFSLLLDRKSVNKFNLPTISKAYEPLLIRNNPPNDQSVIDAAS